jgi:hypothetical protein
MKTLQVRPVRGVRDPVERQRKKCLRKFIYYFPGGYQGKKYQSWERDYKWNAHLLWQEQLNRKEFSRLLNEKNFSEIARRATYIESRTNLLFSFEKMALRDAVKPDHGAEAFSLGLFDLVYGKKQLEKRFEEFKGMLGGLPRKQTRVLTWPLLTVFGFLADPEKHIFLKPRVTQTAAEKYGFDFRYRSRPNWDTYQSLLDFAETVRKDTAHLKPRDMIDLQSFIWVTGSDEYPD